MIRFAGAQRPVPATAGETVLAAAQRAGIDIVATCGGRGRCRSCRVKVLKGSPPPAGISDLVQLGDDEVGEGYRLACQFTLSGEVELQIAPPLAESAFQILSDTAAVTGRLELDSGVARDFVRPRLPDEENHQTSDLEALLQSLDGEATLALDTLRALPAALRESSDGVTARRFGGRLIALEPGDRRTTLGLALDVGTTTVVAYLMDLDSGENLATVSGLNPQTVYGGDLMSRIAFAMQEPGNTRRLRSRLVRYLNELIGEACQQAQVAATEIYKVSAVGNTCMHHLLLGIDPTHLGQAPYAPALRRAYVCAAREVGLKVNPGARLCALPLVAGFVGADSVAMILATGLDRQDGVRLAVDIGTNAEMVMSLGGRLVACSSPAGPALEGAQVRCGMRAALGAIDRVTLEQGDLLLRTIGGAPALGLCGSGLVDALAVLLDAGIIEANGRMPLRDDLPPPLQARLRANERGIPEFLLLAAADAGNERDIVLGQGDIRQIQLAKSAILSGIQTLQLVLGVADDGIDELLLSGAFGNYLDLQSVRRVGLIPDLAAERVRYVANAAGLGAQMALLSETERRRADDIASAVRHVPLAGHLEFQDIFLAATAFPS
ncbi:MAG: ASKHA domain-containing protein [Alphaproteobacteria bacterium]|nr:ASKHA domain-containing protein [Alphaproteobacteria bacterium]